MEVSKQRSEDINLGNKGNQESSNVEDKGLMSTRAQEEPSDSSVYWKEGWESQIAALKVELAQLRFENESLSLQVKNLQSLQSNSEHENLVGSRFSKKKNKGVEKRNKEDVQLEKNSFESVSEEAQKETVPKEISVDVLRVAEEQSNEEVQGILSLRDDSLVFEPFDLGRVVPDWKPIASLSLEKRLKDIPELSFSKRVLKDANVTIPMGFIHIYEKPNLVFMGLQRPMEYLYFSTQEFQSCLRTSPRRIPLFTPKLLQNSSILRPNDLILLSLCMPKRYQNCDWSLLYSTNDHGISIHTFYSRVMEKSPTLLLVKNTDGDCFGCYASQPWKPNLHYYGTGECFVFTLSPEYHVYRWSSENHSFQLSNMDFLAIGGGKHFAIWIDSDFVSGTSGECDTFHSPTLSSHEEFTCHILEAWYPVSY